jgi:MFS transporter, DHA1 family, arabinose polymer utilization protein
MRYLRPDLASLSLGGLAIGMAEFIPMGVLPDIARSLNITISQSGHLISAYAVGVVIGAPFLVAVGERYPPRRVLVAFMLMFALFNALFVMVPSLPLLVATRFLAGLPHGAFFGLGAVVASRLAAPGREASAVATMFAGLTIANIIGVPVGTYLGHKIHWRVPFMAVAAIAFVAAWAIHRSVPNLDSEDSGGIVDALRVFTTPRLWNLIGISAIGTGGLYGWISYIAPLVTGVTGIAANRVATVMILAGLGMAVGNWLGGRIADRHSPLRAVTTLLAGMVIASVTVALLARFEIATLVMTFVTGAVAFSIIAPLQMLMIDTAPGSKIMASAVMQSTANVGNALGAYLGGLSIATGFGLTSPEYIGAGLAFVGFLCGATMLLMNRSTGQVTPQPA